MFPSHLFLGFPHILTELIYISLVFLLLLLHSKLDVDHSVHVMVSLMLYLGF